MRDDGYAQPYNSYIQKQKHAHTRSRYGIVLCGFGGCEMMIHGGIGFVSLHFAHKPLNDSCVRDLFNIYSIYLVVGVKICLLFIYYFICVFALSSTYKFINICTYSLS